VFIGNNITACRKSACSKCPKEDTAMRKPSEAKSRFVYFWLFPSSAVRNKKVRRSLYVLTFVMNYYRFMKAFDQEEKEARAQVIFDRQRSLHLSLVDHAIENDRVVYKATDDAFLRSIGIES